MRKLSLLLIASIGLFSILWFTSCNSDKKNSEEEIATYSVDELLAEAEGLVEKTVIIEGLCTHTCSHGAKKLFLMGSEDTKTIRVEASEKIGAFSTESVNSMVSVKGKVMEERIDEAYLVKWETSIEEQTAEEHGEEGAAGCETEKLAQNEAPAETEQERIENFRQRIAEEKAKTGKPYLSFYYIEAESYEIK